MKFVSSSWRRCRRYEIRFVILASLLLSSSSFRRRFIIVSSSFRRILVVAKPFRLRDGFETLSAFGIRTPRFA
jgi:hypothetical protein